MHVCKANWEILVPIVYQLELNFIKFRKKALVTPPSREIPVLDCVQMMMVLLILVWHISLTNFVPICVVRDVNFIVLLSLKVRPFFLALSKRDVPFFKLMQNVHF